MTTLFMFKDTDGAMEYFRRVGELEVDNEANRLSILMDMSCEGWMQQVSETSRSREQIVADYARNYGSVLDIRTEHEGD